MCAFGPHPGQYVFLFLHVSGLFPSFRGLDGGRRGQKDKEIGHGACLGPGEAGSASLPN